MTRRRAVRVFIFGAVAAAMIVVGTPSGAQWQRTCSSNVEARNYGFSVCINNLAR